MVETAHRHFETCQRLRPDSVTCFYRDAMVYKELEGKTRRAIPVFQKAIANWEQLNAAQRKEHHHERPKYVRAMYHLASCMIKESLADRALSLLNKLMEEDKASGFVSDVFKHFALGKTLFRLARYEEALGHLKVAERAAGQPLDFVLDLSAGCHLMMNRPEEALKEIEKIAPSHRRPYIRWREADILVVLGQDRKALGVLEKAKDRDRQSVHKTLIRMARICYSLQEYDHGLACAKEAGQFYRHTYGNPFPEGRFWQALCLYGKRETDRALSILMELKEEGFVYPGFRKACEVIERQCRQDALDGYLVKLTVSPDH
jgi:tetratricopeptide (TPR) repeat protein